MAKLTYKQRKALPSSKFIFPKGTKAKPGRKEFPIEDVRHARVALSRAAQKRTKLTPRERCEVVEKVCEVYPKIGVCAGATNSKLLGKCRI